MDPVSDAQARSWFLRIVAFCMFFWVLRSSKRSVYHVLQRIPVFARYTHVSVDIVIALLAAQVTLVCIAAMWVSLYPVRSFIIILIPAAIVVILHYLIVIDDEPVR